MCRRVECRQCGKAGWRGCGAHVEQVLAGVAKDDRCSCSRPKGFFAKLLGKS